MQPAGEFVERAVPHAAVLMTTDPGIANSAVGLATDFQSRYLDKLLTTPAGALVILLLGTLFGNVT
ncbi:MAG TPA: hypothetical protein VFX51_11455 [Solirubrobacteraceae bacterium]|nr:hypothetical protein [Solirubrobacteraceae bacterium]